MVIFIVNILDNMNYLETQNIESFINSDDYELNKKKVENEFICKSCKKDIEIKFCTFSKVSLNFCDFEKSYFENVIFKNCDLSNTSFERSTFKNVQFIDCKLVGTIMSGSYINNTNIKNSNCCNLIIQECTIYDSTFEDSNFISSNIGSSKQKNLKINKCNFDYCNFSNTLLNNIDFSTCSIEGIIVYQNDLKGSIMNYNQAIDFIKILGIKVK